MIFFFHKMEDNAAIDTFSIIHFMQYLIVGIIFPGYYAIIILLSIAWEVFEYESVKDNTTYLWLKRFWFIEEKYWNERLSNKVFDLIFNLLGYFIGSQIRYKIYP